MHPDESISHFRFVLRQADQRKQALQAQIAELQREAREVTVTIGGILRLAPAAVMAEYAAGLITDSNRAKTVATVPESQRFVAVSMRWAILLALSDASSPISIPDLAETLKSGGIVSNATNFANNVSSVLSRMKADKGEVDVIEGRWFISDVGRSAISYIKAQKLRRRTGSRNTETPDVAAPGVNHKEGES